MASLHFSWLTALCACLGHTVFITDGAQPPLKVFHHSCSFKMDEGPCKAAIDRFYFSVETGRCEPFEYGGCHGNENNFETIEECHEKCLVKPKKSPCHLEDEPGPCRGLVPRYFFDSKAKECRRFFYGGCFGNANNFRTLKDCQDRCQPGNDTEEPQDNVNPQEKTESDISAVVITDVHAEPESYIEPQKLPRLESHTSTAFMPPDFCRYPVNRGDCDGKEKRFFYNSSTKRCQSFHYSGCGGNKNNFSNRRMCMKTCRGDYNQIRIKTKKAKILFRSL